MDVLEFYKFSIEYLSDSRFGEFAEWLVFIVVVASVIFVVAGIFYSNPIKKLQRDIGTLFRRGANKLKDANTSPYDEAIKNNKYFSYFYIGYFYLICVFMLLYSLVFFALGLNVGVDILWYNQFLSIGLGLMFLMLSRLFKVQGDKELFKFRDKKT